MNTSLLKFVITCIVVLCMSICACAQELYMNQIGYPPTSLKHAFVSKEFQGEVFDLIDIETKELAFEGKISEAKIWPHSGTVVCVVDFSDLEKEGQYLLKIGDYNFSKEVIISHRPQESLGKASLKSFFFARVSKELTNEFAGIYERPMGHPDNIVKIHSSAASINRPEGSIISSPGGWYDAGDYNKYIVNSSIAVHTLLQLYELFPDYMKTIKVNIPESENNIPDLLDEVLVNLRWMLSMQDQNDGGVYHKLTSKNFCGEVMPHEDLSERFVVSKSTSAALDFASVTAKSYRVFLNFEKELPGLADSCLVASKNAWKWSELHPDVLYVQPEDITTGEYGDSSIRDEKYWAAHELYLSTGKKTYINGLNFKNTAYAPQWADVGTLSTFSWLGNVKFSDNTELESQKRTLLESAESYYKVFEESAYKVSINSFAWGSNGDLAFQGELFIHAYLTSKDSKYIRAAQACLNYILGANPLDKCFVTGHGINRPMHIHDRRSFSDGIAEPIPGLLAGGPNVNTLARVDCGASEYHTNYPAMSYIDVHCSYSTNEIAINWNAPLVFLVNALNAIYRVNE